MPLTSDAAHCRLLSRSLSVAFRPKWLRQVGGFGAWDLKMAVGKNKRLTKGGKKGDIGRKGYGQCWECGEMGHPRRECPKFLERMGKGQQQDLSALKGTGKYGKGGKWGKGGKGKLKKAGKAGKTLRGTYKVGRFICATQMANGEFLCKEYQQGKCKKENCDSGWHKCAVTNGKSTHVCGKPHPATEHS